MGSTEVVNFQGGVYVTNISKNTGVQIVKVDKSEPATGSAYTTAVKDVSPQLLCCFKSLALGLVYYFCNLRTPPTQCRTPRAELRVVMVGRPVLLLSGNFHTVPGRSPPCSLKVHAQHRCLHTLRMAFLLSSVWLLWPLWLSHSVRSTNGFFRSFLF